MENIYDQELTNRLKTASSFHTHLSNVIAGINHEVSPWLGGACNTSSRLFNLIERSESCSEEDKEVFKHKVDKILYALDQATNLLSMLSCSVKRLQNYSLTDSNLKDTINSWVRVTLTDRLIKNLISVSSIEINQQTIDFTVKHSPMLLSQVILNLAKNSIEHNQHMLDKLKIKIYGNKDKKTITYEDNGKGISPDLLNIIFNPGNTTKECNYGQSHGLGLSACMDYCISMGASIWASSKKNKYTKFIIKFEKSYETIKYDRQQSVEYDQVDAMYKLFELKQQLNKQEQEESDW